MWYWTREIAAYAARMATHYVHKLGLYWEEWESYRDERGRPRKRFVKYWGKRDPRRSWGGLGPVQKDGVDWAKIEREEIARQEVDEIVQHWRTEFQREQFKAATGLDLPDGPTDPTVAIEKPPSKIDFSKSTEPAPVASEPASATQQSIPDSLSSDAPTDAGANPSPEGKLDA